MALRCHLLLDKVAKAPHAGVSSPWHTGCIRTSNHSYSNSHACPSVVLRQRPCSRHVNLIAQAQQAAATDIFSVASEASADDFLEVEKLLGLRVSLDFEDPVVEYRVRWKDDSPDTW